MSPVTALHTCTRNSFPLERRSIASRCSAQRFALFLGIQVPSSGCCALVTHDSRHSDRSVRPSAHCLPPLSWSLRSRLLQQAADATRRPPIFPSPRPPAAVARRFRPAENASQMVDYSKWDKLANSLGEDYDEEDEDSRRNWMSRYYNRLRCHSQMS